MNNHSGPMHKLSDKHHRRLKFGPSHHPLGHPLEGHQKGQVRHKAPRFEMDGKVVGPARSRKVPCRIGMEKRA